MYTQYQTVHVHADRQTDVAENGQLLQTTNGMQTINTIQWISPPMAGPAVPGKDGQGSDKGRTAISGIYPSLPVTVN